MIEKLAAKATEFRDAENKIAWIRQDWSWRYFRYRQRKQIPLNLEFDRRHNVETADEITLDKVGVSASQAAEGNGIYRCVNDHIFHAAMTQLNIDPTQFSFVDIGSGKGKALFLAADRPFKCVIGVEYAPGLHDVAVQNIASYRSEAQQCRNIQAVHGDALQYTPPDGPLVIFVFNALAPELMTDFLAGLDAGPASDADRPVLLAYGNPRNVRELTNEPFSGLRNLRVFRRSRHLVLVANDAGRRAQLNS